MLIRDVDFGLGAPELFGALYERPGSVLLDSAMAAEGCGQFSFIGCDPFLMFRATGDTITLTRDGVEETRRGNPVAELRKLLHRYRSPGNSRLPFAGGAIGYCSYEFGLRFERIAPAQADDLGVPDVELAFFDRVLAFQAVTGRAFLVANSVDGTPEEMIANNLEQTVREALAVERRRWRDDVTAAGGPLRANFSKAEYLAAIARIKDYIAAGDVYQVNLSQRFTAPLAGHPFALYRRLRARSPAPFASYLNFGERQVLSSSPERFLRLRDGHVETRPIKGTRRRGRNPTEDAALCEQLVASEKDRAELLMIVDLERNDFGRVCEVGSIRCDELYRLEAHPTVFHLAATVSGKLSRGRDVFDCLRAAFPGGSITGAPKIRAMQIINQLEPHRRNVYTGAIGYIGFDGNCDLNVAIRTLQCTQGNVVYNVGGGIVWDSDPESEYQETLDKGRAMRAALLYDADRTP